MRTLVIVETGPVGPPPEALLPIIDAFKAFVGWVGVTKPYWFEELLSTPEIGWFMDRAHGGQGLATEGAKAALDFAFGQLGIPRLLAICNAENRASERVMQKIGMTFWKEVRHPEFGFPLKVYEIEPK